MTVRRALVHAKKMMGRIKRGYVPETIWYKCIMCDEKPNDLVDIYFGMSQLNNHVRSFHGVMIARYTEICNGLEWFEWVVTQRFQQVLMNVYRDDVDGQLQRIKREAIWAKTGTYNA